MEDHDIVARIDQLAEEERTIEGAHLGRPLSSEEQERLRQLGVRLDQCWDLLAQRRARRNAGQDPDAAQLRDEGTVEHFLQ